MVATWRNNTAADRTISQIYTPLDIPTADVPVSIESFLSSRDNFTASMPGHEELVLAIFQSHYKLYDLLQSDLQFDFSSVLDSLSSLMKYRHLPLLVETSDIEHVDNQYRVKLPSHIFQIGAIVNKPFEPTVTWDDEFYIDGDYLYFLSDPRSIFQGYYAGSGKYFYVLWLKDVIVLDTRLLDRFFTYLPGFSNRSLDYYYDRVLFTKLAIEILGKGLTPNRLRGLAGLYYGIPVSIAETETIADIQATSDGWLVVTDKTKYQVSNGFELAVTEGTKLTRWTPLVANFDVIDFHDGVVPSYLPKLPIYPDSFLTVISAERATENGQPRELENLNQRLAESGVMLSVGLRNILYAVNNTVATTIEQTERGTEISWPLEGDPDDVALFWSRVRERERASGVMLYDLLRQYYNDLSTINPAEVMARFFYRQAVVILLPNVISASSAFIEIVDGLTDSSRPIFQLSVSNLPRWTSSDGLQQAETETIPSTIPATKTADRPETTSRYWVVMDCKVFDLVYIPSLQDELPQYLEKIVKIEMKDYSICGLVVLTRSFDIEFDEPARIAAVLDTCSQC